MFTCGPSTVFWARLILAGFVCVGGLLSPVGGLAQGQAPILCNPATIGMTQCMGGVVCACRFAPGVAATGAPAGYRWNCSLLQPRCADAAPPATIGAAPYTAPTTLLVDPNYQPPSHGQPQFPDIPTPPASAGRFITPFLVEVPSFVHTPQGDDSAPDTPDSADESGSEPGPDTE